MDENREQEKEPGNTKRSGRFGWRDGEVIFGNQPDKAKTPEGDGPKPAEPPNLDEE